MPAYLIGRSRVKDPQQWSICVEGVKKSLIPIRDRAAEVVIAACEEAK